MSWLHFSVGGGGSVRIRLYAVCTPPVTQPLPRVRGFHDVSGLVLLSAFRAEEFRSAICAKTPFCEGPPRPSCHAGREASTPEKGTPTRRCQARRCQPLSLSGSCEILDRQPLSLSPALQAEFGELHAFGAFEQCPREGRFRAQFGDELHSPVSRRRLHPADARGESLPVRPRILEWQQCRRAQPPLCLVIHEFLLAGPRPLRFLPSGLRGEV